MDFGWETCSLLLHRELPPSARHRKFEPDWGGKKKGDIKNNLGQTHWGTKRRCVHSKGEKLKPCCCVLIEAGLGCSLRVTGTLKEFFLFASSIGPKQWLWFVGEALDSVFLPAPLTRNWVDQSYSPHSAAFCDIPVLPFLAVVALTLNSSCTDGSVHPEQEPPNLRDTKLPVPRTFTSCWLQKWKMNHYTFLFPTLKVSFSSQTTSLFVCRGKVFSAVNKNVGSKAQVTANRKKSVSMHYHIPAKAPMTEYLPQLLPWVSIFTPWTVR